MGFIISKNLSKEYQFGQKKILALNNVNINIKKNEYICLVGPSGAGKSTLLNILGLIDDATSGELLFDDVSILNSKPKVIHNFRKSHISFIFQNFNLIPILSAYENIDFPMIIQNVDRKERKYRIDKLAESVGIKKYLAHRPDELSGGQQQRVAIARALVTKPEIVLADEPTANLDSVTSNNILAMIKQIQKEEKTTFIVASHDSEIMKRADRIIRIIDGKTS